MRLNTQRRLLAVVCLMSCAITTGSVAADTPHGGTAITVSYAGDASGSHTVFATMQHNYTLSQTYSWTDSAPGRFSLTAYQMDNGPTVPIARLGNGNFTLNIPVDSDHHVIFYARQQFEITSVETNMTFIPISPTGDNWFDKDSDVQIIMPYVMQSGDQSRRQLFGWSLDNSDVTMIPRQESGFFRSSPIHMSENHEVSPAYKDQYHVSVISNFGRALGTGWYDSGTIADISVMPEDDTITRHVFLGWQGQVIGDAKQYSANIMVDSPKVLVANWFVDYTNLSIIFIAIIAIVVLLVIYQKRKIPARK